MYVTENRLHIFFISFSYIVYRRSFEKKITLWWVLCYLFLSLPMYMYHLAHNLYENVENLFSIFIAFSLLFVLFLSLSSFFHTPSFRCFNYTSIFIGFYLKWFYYHLETPCYPNGNTVINPKKKLGSFWWKLCWLCDVYMWKYSLA